MPPDNKVFNVSSNSFALDSMLIFLANVSVIFSPLSFITSKPFFPLLLFSLELVLLKRINRFICTCLSCVYGSTTTSKSAVSDLDLLRLIIEMTPTTANTITISFNLPFLPMKNNKNKITNTTIPIPMKILEDTTVCVNDASI